MKKQEAGTNAEIKNIEAELAEKDALIAGEKAKRDAEAAKVSKAWYDKYEKIRKNKKIPRQKPQNMHGRESNNNNTSDHRNQQSYDTRRKSARRHRQITRFGIANCCKTAARSRHHNRRRL